MELPFLVEVVVGGKGGTEQNLLRIIYVGRRAADVGAEEEARDSFPIFSLIEPLFCHVRQEQPPIRISSTFLPALLARHRGLSIIENLRIPE